MQKPFFIRKVAVLGAGVMGAQIAAHVTNAGIETYLFDLASDGADAYKLVKTSIQKLKKLKPAPFGISQDAALIRACHYDADLEKLGACDLVIEAIGERLDWKEALYTRIAPYLGEKTVLVSNTSGLSIGTLASVLPEALKTRFCGVHFFNPPRYMHLAELIPAPDTPVELLNQLETWLTTALGKGVVRAKDTPNFIANRVGVFSLLATLHHAERLGIGLEVVDALTGVLLGRPKSATFRTMDVVGLDTLGHVVHTMDEHLKNDPWHRYFKLPDWLQALIKAGHLGQKTGQGVYRKRGKSLEVYDVAEGDYRPVKADISDEIKAIFKLKTQSEQFAALLASKAAEAELVRACFRDLFHYAAFHLEAIADSVAAVDSALKWGFGWQQGPFETWQAFGEAHVREWIEAEIKQEKTMANASIPVWHAAKASTDLPVYARQISPVKKAAVLFENEGVVLSDLKNDVAVLSFKTKSNIINQSVLDGLQEAVNVAEAKTKGMIVYQNNPTNFSSGADLSAVSQFIERGEMSALASMVHDFQRVLMRLKYSTVPVVSALRGRALGGGCELLMHCDLIVAAFESYPGLVEAGVGLLPAGGGSKELALRAAKRAIGRDMMPALYPYFEQAAMGVVSGSAKEALTRGYLRAKDKLVMHAGEVLFVALAAVESMDKAYYTPPIPERFRVVGREGAAQMKAALVNYSEGAFISAHDAYIATQIAEVMSGGDVDAGTEVDEAWILRLEHAAFMRLAETPETKARIAHMLATGRPLRN